MESIKREQTQAAESSMRRNIASILVAILLGIVSLTPRPVAAQSFGEALLAGYSSYPFQHYSTMGDLISNLDDYGCIYLVWTSFGHAGNPVILGNVHDESDGSFICPPDEELTVNPERRAWQPMTVYHPNFGLAVFYTTESGARAALDFEVGFMAFASWPVQWPNDTSAFIAEPKSCAVAEGDMILCGATPSEEMNSYKLAGWHLTYTIGEHWITRVSQPTTLDTIFIPSHTIVSNPSGNRVALIYHRSISGTVVTGRLARLSEFLINNDLYIIYGDSDGVWNLNNRHNITRTRLLSPDSPAVEQVVDTLRPYPDIDALWTANPEGQERLHVVFSVRGLWLNVTGDSPSPLARRTGPESQIWHWDNDSDSLTLVADGWFPNNRIVDDIDGNVSKPSLGVDEEGNLYCLFRQARPDEPVGDRHCSGDVMLSVSDDNGRSWSEPINLTDTCLDGLDSALVDEQYPCLAEAVDENLHISYHLGMAGSGVAPPDEQSERSVIYLRVPLQELPDLRSLQLPREDFQYHSAPPLAANEDRLPTGSYVLINLSPNPFNSAATATIRLERRQDVSLILTDTQGREAATLFRGRMGAGETNLSFSAGDLPSGVYILQLKGATGVSAIKTAIVR